MIVKIFAINAANSWLHAYEVDDAAVNGMPVGAELYDVKGNRYTVNGTKLVQSGPHLSAAALDARLLTALATIEQSLQTRLDHHAIDVADRADRLAEAKSLLAVVRARSNPAERFDAMRRAFVHGGVDINSRPGSWLHNLFCH
jgi:hypothetical protein